jgi:hypothetical protein
MGLFGRSARHPPKHDFSTGPVLIQSDAATTAPDVIGIVRAAIAESNRPDVDLTKVIAGVDRVLVAQIDVYATALPSIDRRAVKSMCAELVHRNDFGFEMYFTGLTYFGPSGVAMANGLAEQFMVFVPELIELIRAGHYDRDNNHTARGGHRDERI